MLENFLIRFRLFWGSRDGKKLVFDAGVLPGVGVGIGLGQIKLRWPDPIGVTNSIPLSCRVLG